MLFTLINNKFISIDDIGISTKPPYLMMAWYYVTGNQDAMNRMMGAPPGIEG